MTDVLIKRGDLDTDMYTGKMMQRFTGERQPPGWMRGIYRPWNAKDCQQIAKALRGKGVFFLRLSERAWYANTLIAYFEPPEL